MQERRLGSAAPATTIGSRSETARMGPTTRPPPPESVARGRVWGLGRVRCYRQTRPTVFLFGYVCLFFAVSAYVKGDFPIPRRYEWLARALGAAAGIGCVCWTPRCSVRWRTRATATPER